MDLITCLRDSIAYSQQYYGLKKFNWVLPRKCGATTFLINVAKEELNLESNVLFIAANRTIKDYIFSHFNKSDRGINIITMPDKGRINVLRGKQYNVILKDNISHHYFPKGLLDELDMCLQPIEQKAKLIINLTTTIGEQ